MPYLLFRALLLATVVCVGCSAYAQTPAPIERRSPAGVTDLPAAPEQPALSKWPDAADVRPGTTLLVSTFDSVNPHICQGASVDEAHVVCRLSRFRAQGVEYDRSMVDSLQIAPKGYAALSGAKIAAFDVGGLSLVMSMACGVDGGPPCKTPGVLGLSLVATGAVLQLVQWHSHAKAVPLYRAPLQPRRYWLGPLPPPLWRR
jgi:hypothetical protein